MRLFGCSSKKTVQTVVKVGADGLFQFCFNLPAYVLSPPLGD